MTYSAFLRPVYTDFLVWFDVNVPVINFVVILGRSHRFLGITSTFWGILLKDTTRRAEWGSNPRPPDPGFEVLTIRPPRQRFTQMAESANGCNKTEICPLLRRCRNHTCSLVSNHKPLLMVCTVLC